MRVERSGVSERPLILSNSARPHRFLHLKLPPSEPDLPCVSPDSLCIAGALVTCVPLGLSFSTGEINAPAP